MYIFASDERKRKLSTLLDWWVPSLRRGHVNLRIIVPILTYDPRRESCIFSNDDSSGHTGRDFV